MSEYIIITKLINVSKKLIAMVGGKVKEVIIKKDPKNRTFGIKEEDFTEKELEILKEFARYIKDNNVRSLIFVRVEGFDRSGIVNRISILIRNDRYKIKIYNVYCGGVMGSDRVFEVLYDFEKLLGKLMGEEFNHYSEYSISRNYIFWRDFFDYY